MEATKPAIDKAWRPVLKVCALVSHPSEGRSQDIDDINKCLSSLMDALRRAEDRMNTRLGIPRITLETRLIETVPDRVAICVVASCNVTESVASLILDNTASGKVVRNA